MRAGQSWTGPVRPRRPMRTGMVFAGVAVALCCVGVAGLGVWNLQVVTQAAGPVRETTDEFLRSVTVGDTDGAYDRLCEEARGKWSEIGFTSWVKTPPMVRDYEITDVSVSTRGGRPRGTVTVQITRDSGTTEERKLPVVQEGRHWRICGDPF